MVIGSSGSLAIPPPAITNNFSRRDNGRILFIALARVSRSNIAERGRFSTYLLVKGRLSARRIRNLPSYIPLSDIKRR